MTENEQIQEMALIICGFKDCTSCISRMGLRKCGAKAYAERLIQADYRKVERGEWIEKDGAMVCSKCSEPKPIAHATILRTIYYNCNHCRNCGAKMKGGE